MTLDEAIKMCEHVFTFSSEEYEQLAEFWCYGYDKGVADVMSKVKELQEKNLKECKKYDD